MPPKRALRELTWNTVQIFTAFICADSEFPLGIGRLKLRLVITVDVDKMKTIFNHSSMRTIHSMLNFMFSYMILFTYDVEYKFEYGMIWYVHKNARRLSYVKLRAHIVSQIVGYCGRTCLYASFLLLLIIFLFTSYSYTSSKYYFIHGR